MQIKKHLGLGLIVAMAGNAVALADDISSAIANGTVSGNVRAYYNTRDYETKTDTQAFALGGALRAETGSLGAFKLGLGYYTAQDLGTNSSDAPKVNKSLGSNLEVLAQAYIKLSVTDTGAILGRQIINTPFANAGDAFIIPFSFEGISIKNTSLSNLTIELDHINTIKNRNFQEFVDVGAFSTNRFGVAQASTSGTTILGASYVADALKLQGWYYDYDDLFNSVYIQADYNFSMSNNLKSFVAIQLAKQQESGDKLLGEVDSTLWGGQGGIAFENAKITLAYNIVSEEQNTFKNGAFLSPYTYSTSPLFTNNMLTTFENADAGQAIKVTFNYDFEKLKLKASYAEFDFEIADDREAVDLDIIYSLDQTVKGLSARWRVEFVTSDNDNVEQINNRVQLQLNF